MKKKIITLAMVVAGASLSFAQDGISPVEKKEKKEEAAIKPTPGRERGELKQKPKPTERANAKTEEMDKVVSLDEDQKSKIAIINKEQNEKMRALRTEFRDKEDKSEMKEKSKAIQKERKTRVRAVLTEEQKVKWKKHQQAKKERKAPVQENMKPAQAK